MNRKTFGRTTVEADEIDVRTVGPERDEKLRDSRSHHMGGWHIMEQTVRASRRLYRRDLCQVFGGFQAQKKTKSK